jgi:hypothetical protein
MPRVSRREFLRTVGVSAAVLPFVSNLPGLAFENQTKRKQRLLIVFTPDGTVPWNFWPDEVGANFKLKSITAPLEAYRDKLLFLKGISNRVRGDGDGHMRGIGCLLTGIELFPGNIQGGSDTPAGWSSGLSIDQEIRNQLQKDAASKTRFGSLEFGVMVPDRADTWTRMVYVGANKPVAPIDNPYQMFNKLYGRKKDNAVLASVLDDLNAELKKVAGAVTAADRKLIDDHATFVREMEVELKADAEAKDVGHKVPELEQGVREENDNMPKISKMQTELIVNSFLADFTRVATFQFTNSVGEPKMRWLGVEEGQHALSHEPDSNKEAQEKLTKINKWYCEQIAYLTKRLAETPEPGGNGSLLDNTTIIWTNELGQGNSHTHDNIPWLMIGGGLGFKTGRSLKYKDVPHNRLLLSLAHAFGHELKSFGNGDYCKDGPLTDLT